MRTIAVALLTVALASGCAAAAANSATSARSTAPAKPTAMSTAKSTAAARNTDPAATPTPTMQPLASAAPIAGTLGKYQVAEKNLTFRRGSRTLATEVWYPVIREAGQPGAGLPLIMFAPGYLECSGTYAPLLKAWASAGYVVAGVNFPRTDCHMGNAAYEPDLVHQPADLSYVMSRLLDEQPLPVTLNPHQIAAAGQSDGGDTVAAMAANTCCTDRRLAAVAVLSGQEWGAMPGRYFAAGPAPMLFIQGSADTINLPWTSKQMYAADRSKAKYYLDVFGASHLGPYTSTGTAEQIVARVTVAFFDRYLLHQAGAPTAMQRAGNTGASALVSGGVSPR